MALLVRTMYQPGGGCGSAPAEFGSPLPTGFPSVPDVKQWHSAAYAGYSACGWTQEATNHYPDAVSLESMASVVPKQGCANRPIPHHIPDYSKGFANPSPYELHSTTLPLARESQWNRYVPDRQFRTGAAAFYVQEQMKTVVYGYNASVDYLYLSTDRPVPVSLQAKRLSPGTQFTGIKGPNGVLFPRTNKLQFATFVTNGDEEVSQGFNITVKAIESSPSAPCGWNVTIIREPVTIHYRKNNTQETLCVWHLFAVRGPQTLLRIQEMVTESQTYNDRRIYTSCEDDYLEIQEQSSIDNWKLGAIIVTALILLGTFSVIVSVWAKRVKKKEDVRQQTTTKEIHKELGPEYDQYKIKNCYLKLEPTVLGQGNYGLVLKGVLRQRRAGNNPAPESSTQQVISVDVAVKRMLLVTKTNERQLLDEIKMLAKASTHPNVIALMRITTDGELRLITELCVYGSLDKYLRKERQMLKDQRESYIPNWNCASGFSITVFCFDIDKWLRVFRLSFFRLQ
ncbi:uncharacterized protein LOC129596792 isoform X3 [Paramacrobiotus metropolitanus]|uniref:uncharacterized protein LOC129596792 isoform X3 n=1 Tax=Paramacrobiotus metropolitanus TaxID=2943436 RepID=UPI002445C39B|nr:uncharacterized protein LOC129596792 isoform X3 [Paramacrobiotus metropolitanus]